MQRVAITTPTGNIGRELTKILQSETGHHLTLLARDPSRLAAETERGATVKQGDLLDPGFLLEATRGADALFFLIPPNFGAEDFRGFQNRIAAAGVEAANRNEIAHVVLISSVGAQHAEGVGPVNGLHDAEVAFGDADLNVTVLRPGWFMENYYAQLDAIKGAGSIFMPMAGSSRVPMIATVDIARAAADVLIAETTVPRLQELLGPRDVSLDEAAGFIGEAIGRPVQHVQVTPDQAKEAFLAAGIGPDLTRLYLEMFDGYRDGLFAPEFPRTEASTTPTEFSAFARNALAPAFGQPA